MMGSPTRKGALALKEYLNAAERQYWEALLDKHNWNVSKMSREEDFTRATVIERMAALGIKRNGRGGNYKSNGSWAMQGVA